MFSSKGNDGDRRRWLRWWTTPVERIYNLRDFQPDTDFLIWTVPILVRNPEIGLVQGLQAWWKFVNSNECLMTKIQEMSMDYYHFKVEQESGSTMFRLFGFNGTAGVWRISAINEAGGWKDRTTVEDMDLAVRAILSS